MKRNVFLKTLCVLLVCAVALCGMTTALAADGTVNGDQYTFTDRNGNTVTVPVNAFASYVVSFQHGNPWKEPGSLSTFQEDVLGLPDLNENATSGRNGELTLGTNGVLVVGFPSSIYDGPGDDVYVFETGGWVEATRVEVSNDLETWYDLGVAEGSTAGLDLNGKVPEGMNFKYVRLTDTGENGVGDYPGADIDAVCGLNTKPLDPSEAGQEYSYSTMNTAAVQSGVKKIRRIEIPADSKPIMIDMIRTYHWNDGRGTEKPGRIVIREVVNSNGSWTVGDIVGSWEAEGETGSGIRNLFWVVHPGFVLQPGKSYCVLPSDTSTWSCNEQSGMNGMMEMTGHYLEDGRTGSTETASISTSASTSGNNTGNNGGSGGTSGTPAGSNGDSTVPAEGGAWTMISYDHHEEQTGWADGVSFGMDYDYDMDRQVVTHTITESDTRSGHRVDMTWIGTCTFPARTVAAEGKLQVTATSSTSRHIRPDEGGASLGSLWCEIRDDQGRSFVDVNDDSKKGVYSGSAKYDSTTGHHVEDPLFDSATMSMTMPAGKEDGEIRTITFKATNASTLGCTIETTWTYRWSASASAVGGDRPGEPVTGSGNTPQDTKPQEPSEMVSSETAKGDAYSYSTMNADAVQSGVKKIRRIEIPADSRPIMIDMIRTYHWNDGLGTVQPGRIIIREVVNSNGSWTVGEIVGSWDAEGESYYGLENIYWVVYPGFVLQPGKSYCVLPSDTGTWSCNEKSGMNGMMEMTGHYLEDGSTGNTETSSISTGGNGGTAGGNTGSTGSTETSSISTGGNSGTTGDGNGNSGTSGGISVDGITLEINKTVYEPGETITVSYSGITEEHVTDRAWVGVAAASASPMDYMDWQFVKPGSSTVMLKAPGVPGSFEVRLFLSREAKHESLIRELSKGFIVKGEKLSVSDFSTEMYARHSLVWNYADNRYEGYSRAGIYDVQTCDVSVSDNKLYLTLPAHQFSYKNPNYWSSSPFDEGNISLDGNQPAYAETITETRGEVLMTGSISSMREGSDSHGAYQRYEGTIESPFDYHYKTSAVYQDGTGTGDIHVSSNSKSATNSGFILIIYSSGHRQLYLGLWGDMSGSATINDNICDWFAFGENSIYYPVEGDGVQNYLDYNHYDTDGE